MIETRLGLERTVRRDVGWPIWLGLFRALAMNSSAGWRALPTAVR